MGPDWLPILNERAETPEVDFVRREVSIALRRKAEKEIEIFPIVVGRAGVPNINMLHDDLRGEIGELFDHQAHEFHSDAYLWDCQFDRLRRCLAQVEGVPKPFAQSLEDERSLTLGSKKSNLIRRPTSVDVQAVRQAFGGVSSGLLNWPQETDGQWIERPELDLLYSQSVGAQPLVMALLGGPGEGKSAVLARLGSRLSEDGVVLLAIKADQIPRSMETLRDLDNWIGCEVPVTEALRRLAADRKVVVLIDQLDALADLMDQHSERLGSLTRFVNAVSGIQNLSVIVSCREFEFHNDVRFKTLSAQEVSLVRVTWEQVEPLLTARGLETTGWSRDVRGVLRTPQHLAMFLDHLAENVDGPMFTNYQGLLTRILQERVENVHGARTVEAAEQIATTMALEEELWLGRSRFEREFGAELQRLEEAGFLVRSDNGMSIAFRHQTLFDFLRARAFLRDRQSLAEYVVDLKQQSLFVRPILWSTLNYLRASDRPAYRYQFERLLARENLRPHIQNLLIAFLGHLPDPDYQEAHWLLPRLDEFPMRAKVLRATAGSPGWFLRLRSRLRTLMTAEPEAAAEVTTVLGRAASFEPTLVLQAVCQYWISDERYLPYALSVLRRFGQWDQSSVEIVCRLADHAPIDTFGIHEIARKISESKPNLAPKVIARYFLARIGKLDRNELSCFGQVSHEQSDLEQSENVRDTSTPYERLIDDNSGWHGIEEIAQLAPRAFVEEMWPWLVKLFTRLAREENPLLRSYRDHDGLAFKRVTSKRQPLQAAIETGIREFARTEVEHFLDFVERQKNTDLKVLHRLLSLGLEKSAKPHPKAVLRYLLEDFRRFSMGDVSNDQRDTQALVSAVVPWLEGDEALRLETAIRKWSWYQDAPENEDAAARLDQRKWMRERRLRLLRAFPLERLSPGGKRHFREEERAFPEAPTEDKGSGAVWIGSPMSSEQMLKATDDQVLALFEELTDDTEWDHPRRRFTDFVGGSVQASREFAKFASDAPHRAMKLMGMFEAGKTERPAGYALAKLAKSSATPEGLVECVHALDERGFASEAFRSGSAQCLGALAVRFGGLTDETCRLLEEWIIDWRAEPATGSVGDNNSGSLETMIEEGPPAREPIQSFLWDPGRSRTVPQGNYPFLSALMRGFLCRTPCEVDSWLAVLERHLERNEDPAVWREVGEDLWRLTRADRERAVRFLESLFSSRTEILNTATGVSLIARIMPWLPTQLIGRVIDGWIAGTWQHGPQAAGEVLALKFCRNPDDVDNWTPVERILAGGEFETTVVRGLRVGLTLTFVEAWSEPALRALSTPVLVRLSATECVAVEQALSRVFSRVDPLPPDDHTRNLLESLMERPCVLASDAFFLIRALKGLLRDGWNPMLVYRATTALIPERAEDLGDGTASAANAGDLSDIAVTLHRIPATRDLGLRLLEQLMEAQSYELDERIAAIDRMAFR